MSMLGADRVMARKQVTCLFPHLFSQVTKRGFGMLTQDRLKELYSYDADTGEFTRRVSIRGAGPAGEVAGSDSRGYRAIGIDGKIYLAHRLAWLYVHGYFPEHGLDHIDRNPANNRLSNLREATPSCNHRNVNPQRNNKSGIIGVSWEKRDQQWKAELMVMGKSIWLGQSPCKIEAAAHRYCGEQLYGWGNCSSHSTAAQVVSDYIHRDATDYHMIT